jgi:hypothetical protein
MGTGSSLPLNPLLGLIIRAQIGQIFPMINNEFDVTSDQTEDYNCIAWAANDTENWWWPTNPDRYWPVNVPRTESVDSFVEAFESLGYTACDSDLLEAGFEKVAIYCISGIPKHMARQLSSGRWTSKLGPQWDICHHTLNGLSGTVYGNPMQILRRPLVNQTP